MKLNSLSFIIVLSLFAAIFSSNSVTINIEKLDNRGISVCIPVGDSVKFKVTDSNAVVSHIYDGLLVRQSSQQEGVTNYDFVPQNNNTQDYKVYFSHRLSISTSFFGGSSNHFDGILVNIYVRDQC